MTLRTPPRLATWLLRHFGPTYRRESLVGDLLEEYQSQRTRGWYWRQTGAALLISAAGLLRIRLPRLVLNAVLRFLIEMGIVLGGIALAQSNVPHHHVPTAPRLEQSR
jgi:hypothetical protein